MSDINLDLDLAFSEDPFKNIIIVEAASKSPQSTNKPSLGPSKGPKKGARGPKYSQEEKEEPQDEGPSESKTLNPWESLFEDPHYKDMLFEGQEFMVVPIRRSGLNSSEAIKMDKSKLLKEMADMDQGDIIDVHYGGYTFHIAHRGVEFDVDGRRIAEPSDILDFISKKCSS